MFAVVPQCFFVLILWREPLYQSQHVWRMEGSHWLGRGGAPAKSSIAWTLLPYQAVILKSAVSDFVCFLFDLLAFAPKWEDHMVG